MFFCEAEQTLFASFSGKRRILLINSYAVNIIDTLDEYCRLEFWGARPPNPPGSASPRAGSPCSSAKQNKRFLLLFLEKEEYNQRRITYLFAEFVHNSPMFRRTTLIASSGSGKYS
jgi:hypothetical protein